MTTTPRPRGRAAPPPPRDEHAERRAALLSLDPALIRAYAADWGVPLIACDDDALIASAHAARMRDDGMPEAARLHSIHWLAERGDAVAQAALKARRNK